MTNKSDALIILTPGFPENEADSTCIPPQQIFVRALKENNPQLNIIVLTFQYPFFSARYQWNGIDVVSFGSESKGRLYRKVMGVRVWAELKKINKESHIREEMIKSFPLICFLHMPNMCSIEGLL